MSAFRISNKRLHNQYLTRASRHTPEELVAWFGAVQAQEYPHAKWGLGLRMRARTTDAEIERAYDAGAILRTHVMRPTWHFVSPRDVRWMLELTGPRVKRAMGPYLRRMELDTATLTQAMAIFEAALGGHVSLTRAELGDALTRAGIQAKGFRLALIAMMAELDGIICSGPRRGKDFTYALLAERAPDAPRLPRDEAVAELARRYFRSHGPATVGDFVWWSGLLTGDAKRGLEMIGARPTLASAHTYWTAKEVSARAGTEPPLARLLPIYDEYIVAYRHRGPVAHGPSTIMSRSHGKVVFQHALVIRGQVAGTWRTRRDAGAVVVDVIPLRRLILAEREAVAACVSQYGRYLRAAVELSLGIA